MEQTVARENEKERKEKEGKLTPHAHRKSQQNIAKKTQTQINERADRYEASKRVTSQTRKPKKGTHRRTKYMRKAVS